MRTLIVLVTAITLALAMSRLGIWLCDLHDPYDKIWSLACGIICFFATDTYV